MNLNKIKIKKIIYYLIAAIISYIILDQFYFDEYYKQAVNLDRVKMVKLHGDIDTIKDFRPKGLVDWKGASRYFRESVEVMNAATGTHIKIYLAYTREEAINSYDGRKESISKMTRIQSEERIGPHEAYCLSRVLRLRDSDFANLLKTNKYFSQVLFIKNNLVVYIDSSKYYDKTGISKQKMIDTIAEYLESKAAKESGMSQEKAGS